MRHWKMAATAALALGLTACGTLGHVTATGAAQAATAQVTHTVRAGEVILCNPGKVNRVKVAGKVTASCASPARTSGSWHGFAVGDVIVCTTVETDTYKPGDDKAMPRGGTWAHCDDPDYRAQAKKWKAAAYKCAGSTALLDDARHSKNKPTGLDSAVRACSKAVGGF